MNIFNSFLHLTLATLIGSTALIGFSSSANSTPDNSEELPETIILQGTVRDFSDVHPDFERNPGEKSKDDTQFEYGLDDQITTNLLGEDNKPEYAGGSFSTTTKANFDQWFNNVPNVNQNTGYSITLDRQENGVYRYENTDFFPINNQLMGNEERNKNFHFTYEINTAFTYKGGEVFNFSGDDDVWVYIDGVKVIELGGVHSREDANVSIDDIAGLEVGETYHLDFFFAERHTTQSNLVIETTLEFIQPTFSD